MPWRISIRPRRSVTSVELTIHQAPAVKVQMHLLTNGLHRQPASATPPRQDVDQIGHADIAELANRRHAVGLLNRCS
jgi:hypothetical protein